MDEVSGPIIAIALVLCAVFVPIAFISGLTGQFYRQFALTIAISTVISAFNSLTLSPALAAILLKPHGAPPDRLTAHHRPAVRLVLPALQPGLQARLREVPARRRRGRLRAHPLALGRLRRAAGRSPSSVPRPCPTGFVPTQDKQYLVAFAQLPDAASLDRTDAVIREMSSIGLKQAGVQDAVAFPGSPSTASRTRPNAGIVFFPLKPFEERKRKDLSGLALAGALNGQVQPASRTPSSRSSRRRR